MNVIPVNNIHQSEPKGFRTLPLLRGDTITAMRNLTLARGNIHTAIGLIAVKGAAEHI